MADSNQKGPKNTKTVITPNVNIKNNALASEINNVLDGASKDQIGKVSADKENSENINPKEKSAAPKNEAKANTSSANKTEPSTNNVLNNISTSPKMNEIDTASQLSKDSNLQKQEAGKEQVPLKSSQLETSEREKSSQTVISAEPKAKTTQENLAKDNQTSASKGKDTVDQMNEAERLINEARMAMVYGNYSRATQLLSQAMSIISNNPLLKGSGLEGSVQAVKSEIIEVQSGYTSVEPKSYIQISDEEAQAKLGILEKNILEYATSHYRDEEHKERIHSIRNTFKSGEKLDKDQTSEYSNHVMAEDNEQRKDHINNLEAAIESIETRKKRGNVTEEDLKKLEHFKREHEGEKNDYRVHSALRNLAAEAGHKVLPAAQNYIAELQHTPEGAQKVQETISKAAKQEPTKTEDKNISKNADKGKDADKAKAEEKERKPEDIKQNIKKFMESSPPSNSSTLTPPSTPKVPGPTKGPAIGG